jgi:MYXO-CTERM domain-containing protein
MMLVVDRSSSMQGDFDGTDKWAIARAAVAELVDAYDEAIDLGLTTFPAPKGHCKPGGVVVDFDDQDTAVAIAKRMRGDAFDPGRDTPIAATLRHLADSAELADRPGPRYAVVITDGRETCEDRFEPVDAARELSRAGVVTYIVGFGGEADKYVLHEMAVEAGTTRAGCEHPDDGDRRCYYQAENAEQLRTSLADIAKVVGDGRREQCDGVDNDCDGRIDEDLTRPCASRCGEGAEACVNGRWGGCDAAAQGREVCDGVDNDCDGEVDPGCECNRPGETRPCGRTGDDSLCSAGVQRCGNGRTWGRCEAVVIKAAEMCDGRDNDCDDKVDEVSGPAGLCGPRQQCQNGRCVDPLGSDAGVGSDGGNGSGVAVTGGCGCRLGRADSGAGATLWLIAGAALLAVRRRRR